MFEFNQNVPLYRNKFFMLADALSGSLFLIAGSYALYFDLPAIGYIFFAVSTTSILHIFFPFRSIRLLDYALAITLVFVCLALVVQSQFLYPYAVSAAVSCGCSFIMYAYYQRARTRTPWSISYYFWHVGALTTSLLSITAFVESLHLVS